MMLQENHTPDGRIQTSGMAIPTKSGTPELRNVPLCQGEASAATTTRLEVVAATSRAPLKRSHPLTAPTPISTASPLHQRPPSDTTAASMCGVRTPTAPSRVMSVSSRTSRPNTTPTPPPTSTCPTLRRPIPTTTRRTRMQRTAMASMP